MSWLSNLQEQLQNTMSEASKIIQEVNSSDILNLDSMREKQCNEEKVIKSSELTDNVIVTGVVEKAESQMEIPKENLNNNFHAILFADDFPVADHELIVNESEDAFSATTNILEQASLQDIIINVVMRGRDSAGANEIVQQCSSVNAYENELDYLDENEEDPILKKVAENKEKLKSRTSSFGGFNFLFDAKSGTSQAMSKTSESIDEVLRESNSVLLDCIKSAIDCLKAYLW